MNAEKAMAEAMKQIERRQPYVDRLVAEGMPHISALIVAGDLLNRDDAMERVRSGEQTAEAAVVFVGSYGRLSFMLWAVEEGYAPEAWLLDELPEAWRGSDPDDTDPRFLELWQKAWRRNGRRTLRDGPALPFQGTLTVYRGQKAGDQIGIAWSLDRSIAEKFAATLGLRQTVKGGLVLRRQVRRSKVLGYLTGRGESECVVDPSDLREVAS